MISNDDLLKWINSMPLWFRKATVLYYQNGIISDDEINNLVDCCYDDKPYKVENINLINHDNKAEFAIKNIEDVKGVNAICSDKPLLFSTQGLTVVYGLNGSGKSGYIRILKMISGAKYREEIKNNIYSDKPIHPTASITVINDEGKDCIYKCDLRKPGEYEALMGIDIFDTRVSNAYMREAKEASFEPWVFGYFVYMVDVSNRIKAILQSSKEHCIEKPYSFPDELKNTESYGRIQDITYKTKVEDYPSVWSETDENKLAQLKENNQASVLQSRLERNKDRARNTFILKSYFDAFISYFSGSNWNSIQETQAELRKAIKIREETERLFKDNSSELDADSVSLESWKKLWRFAKEYYDNAILPRMQIEFAQEGSRCPLCGQMLEDHSCVARMKSINSYINGRVIEDEETLRIKYNSLLETFPPLKSKEELEVLIDLSGISENKDELVRHNSMFEMYGSLLKDDNKNIDIGWFDTNTLNRILLV